MSNDANGSNCYLKDLPFLKKKVNCHIKKLHIFYQADELLYQSMNQLITGCNWRSAAVVVEDAGRMAHDADYYFKEYGLPSVQDLSLSMLQLDPADRAVHRIAGKYTGAGWVGVFEYNYTIPGKQPGLRWVA